MAELLFTVLFLASLLLAEYSSEDAAPVWLAAAAGVMGGLAYLTRSAALPLLISAPFCFMLRKQYTRAMIFAAALLPAVAGWQLWVRTHLSSSSDLVTLYYTNYFGFQAYNVPLTDLPFVVWHNLDGLLMGIGRALTFDVEYGSKHLERIVAVGAIAGCVRLARQTRKLQFPLCAAGFCALLLVWHYPPDQRFVFPLYPLLLAGLWVEMKNLINTLRLAWAKRAASERIIAAILGTVLASLIGLVVFTTVSGDFVFLPQLLGSYRADLDTRMPVYAWIRQNAPRESNVFAYDDPVAFLYTERRACGLPIPPKLLYHDDALGIDRLLTSIPDFARQNRLSYVLVTQGDFHRDLHADRAEQFAQIVKANTAFQRLYGTPAASVYLYRE